MVNFSRFGTRLLSVFAVNLLGFGLVGFLVWVAVEGVQQEGRNIRDYRVAQVERMADMRQELTYMQVLSARMMAATTPEQASALVGDLQQGYSRLDASLAEFARYSSTDEGKRQVADLQRSMVPYRAAVDGFLAAVRSGDMELAVTSLERDVRPAREPLVKLLADTGSRQKQVLNDRLTVMEADLHTLQLQLLGMLVAVAVVSVLASGWLMARLRSRVNEATVVAERIANSDLAKPVAVTGDDEFTGLLRQMASMRDALHKVVLTVRQSSEGIGLASSEVAAGNQDLSSRTESTASNLEQTASSMEQITATVQQSADAARQANQLASTATAVAVRGGEVVGQVVSTMQDINQSSQKIADIIGVIDSIAFQTNILALNAAVEAARAGEQG
ncbi:MAG: methyl-accepting chemotaxis protein, partial [Burkholderiaceae bacterium]|nr:methyl-accepting chemotaxis protein [Burkholderiaceae bacterium]